VVISCRTKLFDVSSPIEDGAYYGEDFAKWLQLKLSDWQSEVFEEDWGWAVLARNEGYRYIFGVYDHDTTDISEFGPKWVIRLYNQKDRSSWFKKLFKCIPPVAHQEVVDQVVGVLKAQREISEIEVMPLQ
jgi:hypothetical protein